MTSPWNSDISAALYEQMAEDNYQDLRGQVLNVMLEDCWNRHQRKQGPKCMCNQEAQELLEEFEQALRNKLEGPPCAQ